MSASAAIARRRRRFAASFSIVSACFAADFDATPCAAAPFFACATHRRPPISRSTIALMIDTPFSRYARDVFHF